MINKGKTFGITLLLSAAAVFPARAGEAVLPGRAADYVAAGDKHMQDNMLPAAREAYEKAAGIDPEFEGLHARLGALYTILREYDKAIDEIEKAAKSDPGLESEALSQLILLGTYRDNPKTVGYLRRLSAIDPEKGKQASFQVFHARIYGLQETENGFEIGNAVLSLPDDLDGRFVAGCMETVTLFITAGETDKAIEFLQKTLLQKGLSPFVTASLNHSVGMIYAKKLKKPDAGLEYLEKASAEWAANIEFAIHLIDTYRLLGKDAEALQSLERLLAVDPRNKYALFFGGTVYLKQADRDKALECWERLRDADAILFGLIQDEYDAAKRQRG